MTKLTLDNKPYSFFKKISDSILFTIIVAYFVFLTGGALLFYPLYKLILIDSNSPIPLLWGLKYITLCIGVWIVFIITSIIFNRKLLKPLSIKMPGNNLYKTLFGLISGAGLNFLIAFVAMHNNSIKIYFYEFNLGWVIFLFISVFIQSAAEEIVFRLYIYQKIRKNHSAVLAILINSLCFAAAHLGNNGISIFSLISIFVVGILLSLLVYCLNSLYAAMMFHTGWNFMQAMVLGLPNSGIPSEYSIFKTDVNSLKNSFAYDKEFGIEGAPLAIILLSIYTIILLVFYIYIKKNNKFHEYSIWNKTNT